MLFGSTQPAYSIGGSPRKLHEVSSTPGPAAYELKAVEDRKPRPVFGSGRRYQLSKSMSPGPGAYSPPGLFGSGPKPVISGRYQGVEERISTKTPGPGAYTHTGTISPLRYSFGSSPRMPDTSALSPGPGDYQVAEITQKRSPVTKFPRASRDSPGRRSLPGSGNYLPTSGTEQGGFSFSKSYRAPQEVYGTPGPGAYNLLGSTFASGGVTLISRRTLSTGFEKNPGPGHYTFTSSFEVSAPAYSLGKSSRDLPTGGRRDSPSPQHYDPRPVLAKLPDIKIGTGPRAESRATALLGPGDYSPAKPDKRLPVSFKFRLRDMDFEERKKMPVGAK